MSAASGIKRPDLSVGQYYQMLPGEEQGGGQSQSLGSPAGMAPAVVTAAPQLLAAQGDPRAPSIFYPDGSYYIGPTQNRAPHGVGTMHYFATDQDGRLRYEGGFVNGVRQGRGFLTWRNGNTYLGEFNNDQATGEGTKKYYGDNNKVIKLEAGTFQNGVLVQGRRAKPGGWEENGTFNNGRLWNGTRDLGEDDPQVDSGPERYRNGQPVQDCVIL